MSTTETAKRLVAEKQAVKRRKWSHDAEQAVGRSPGTYGFHWPGFLPDCAKVEMNFSRNAMHSASGYAYEDQKSPCHVSNSLFPLQDRWANIRKKAVREGAVPLAPLPTRNLVHRPSPAGNSRAVMYTPLPPRKRSLAPSSEQEAGLTPCGTLLPLNDGEGSSEPQAAEEEEA